MDGPPKDAVAALQIGELARRAEVSLRTVRCSEEEGLPPAAKTSGGMRLSTEADVMRLRFIRRFRAWGLGLEEIKATLAVGGSSMSDSAQRSSPRPPRPRASSATRAPAETVEAGSLP